MATEILMPALSPTMEDGALAKWTVAEGATVRAGDVIAEIETDKATMEVEAVEDGVIARFLVAEGAQGVKVNTPIAVMAGDDDAVATAPTAPEPPPVAPPPAPAARRPSPAAPRPSTVAEHAGPTRKQTMREALRDAMAEEMRADPTVFVMGEEVAEYQGAYKVTQGLLEEFGSSRVIDTPITEQGFAGLGVGAAFGGLRPVVEFMTFNFSMQAIDQIVNSAAKTLYMSGGAMPCPIVFRGPNGAAARVAAQHSQDFAAWYAHAPGLKVCAPSNAADAKGLLKAAIRDPNPVVFLENEILYGKSAEVPETGDHVTPIGAARVARPGADVTLVSFGIGVAHALEAAAALASEGVEAEVVDLRSLRPMDTATVIASVKRTNRCVTVEEGWPVCSIGDHVAATLMREAFDWLDAPVLSVTGKDVPMPYAANLERLALVAAAEIVAAAKQVCYR